MAPETTVMTLVEWWLTPRPDGGATLRVRESGFVRAEHRNDHVEGWRDELVELAALLGGFAEGEPRDATV